MSSKFLDISIIIFKVLCGIAASFMVGFWIFKFNENEDVSAIEYISYETHSDITYPELSICINKPFIYDNLSLDPEVNVSMDEYHQYIIGESIFREEYRNISYSNVTLDMFEYVQYVQLYMRNENNQKIKQCNEIKACPYVSFANNFNGFIKGMSTRCFGFHVNLKISGNVEALHVMFKSELNDMLNMIGKNDLAKSFVVLNYPGQMLNAPETGTPVWSNPNSSLGLLSIKVSTNEILRRRAKRKTPCFSDWMYFDDMVLETHHSIVGCSPPYQNSSKPMCTSKTQLSKSRYDYSIMPGKYYPVPCEGMSSIVFTASKLDYAILSETPNLMITYPKTTRLVTQFKSVDLHALIGNIGGYIGLFLGKYNTPIQFLYLQSNLEPCKSISGLYI